MHCIGLNQITAMHFALYGIAANACIYHVSLALPASADPAVQVIGSDQYEDPLR